MRRIKLITIFMILLIVLSACSTINVDNKVNSEYTDNSAKQGSDMDRLLETITAETAEYKGVCGVDLTWYYKDNVLVIKGTGEMADYLPPSWDITAPWQDISEDIAMVIIQDGVTYIGENAFNGMRALIRVDIANSVVKIGEKAFHKCYNLKQININEGLKIISYYSFGDCDKLSILTIPSTVEEIGYGAFEGAGIQELRFKGDAPKFLDHNGNVKDSNDINFGKGTMIYYSSDSFDKYIDDRYTWVKE